MPMINQIQIFLKEKRNVSTPYRFWKDTGISRPIAYDLWNNPSKLPDARAYSRICDYYGAQPCDFLVWVSDSEPAEVAQNELESTGNKPLLQNVQRSN
jgi:hypothetical protein